MSIEVPLPESVWLQLKVAGYGSRALAYAVDFLLRWVFILLTIFVVLFLLISFQIDSEFITTIFDYVYAFGRDDLMSPIASLMLAFVFLVEWSYPVFFEVVKQGVTPGKKLFGLRVVDENGLPLSFNTSLIRTLFLLVDVLPLFGLVGLISMSLTRRSQRLGDLVARTMVVYDQQQTLRGKVPERFELKHRLELEPQIYYVLESFLFRRSGLLPEVRDEIAEKIKSLLRQSLGNELINQFRSDDFFLEVFLSSEPPRTTA